jgi:uncharacterized protein
MKAYKYLSCSRRRTISASAVMADNFFRRFSGLIFRKRLKDDEVLVLKGCKSIHTIGMRYSIDAAFIDSGGKIVAAFNNLKPWRVTPYFPDAVLVMEARSGFLGKWSMDAGDKIIFE